METKWVKANQIELHVQDNEQEGEAIIFLHFSGANLMMWSRVLPYFQDRYRLILIDLRGHGQSARPETGYHMDEMARDIVGVMNQLELEQAHLVGSSLGAEVGLSIAAHTPQRTLSLVCDGALTSEYGPYGTWEGTRAEFDAFVEGRLEKMRNRPEALFPSLEAYIESRREIFEPIGWWNDDVATMEKHSVFQTAEGQFAKCFGKQAMLEYMTTYFQYRLEDYYRKVKCPVLMVPGEDELENEREVAAMKGLCALAERGSIVEVGGWEHPYGWLLDPEAMCAAILKFLTEEN